MPEFNIKKFLSEKTAQIKSGYLAKIKLPHGRQLLSKLMSFIGSWWRVLLVALTAFIFLYYPLGGLWIHNLDKTTDYEIDIKNRQQSSTVEMAAFLIDREINDKMWTPNLPFFFPSFFLDNMPNFQLGIMKAVSNITFAMSKKLDTPITGGTEEAHLKTAAKLLKYDGHIWMFSPANSFTPVPSAHSQYRKARKQLIKFNQQLNTGDLPFYRNTSDLMYFLTRINKDLNTSLEELDAQIREENNSWTDFKADDVFYYNQGKAYAYYLLLKAMGNDYKEILVDKNVYLLWTRSLKALEDAAKLDALYIRNAELNSLTAPNHLQYLAYFIIKAKDINQDIITVLSGNTTK